MPDSQLQSHTMTPSARITYTVAWAAVADSLDSVAGHSSLVGSVHAAVGSAAVSALLLLFLHPSAVARRAGT